MDASSFRQAAGRFATGVTVVTTGSVDRPHGMTANSFTSVSLEPPLVLVCVGTQRETHDRIAREGQFGVSVLSARQQAVSEFFAGRLDRLPDGAVQLRAGKTGVPLIEGALAHFECSVLAAYPGGDHTIFVARVEEAQTHGDGAPLVFFGGRYRELPA